jgi:prepilin-type N-terminal cleavage/methylation domain-containing protein
MRAKGAPVGAVRPGFTLIEVLVGLTIAALTLTAGFATLGFVRDRADAAEIASATALHGATTRQLLTEWLWGARLRVSNQAWPIQGVDLEEQGVPSDELLFPTTARTPLHVRQTLVRLFIDRDEETPETGLVAELQARQQDEPRRVELVPQAGALNLRFLPDLPDAEWIDFWMGQSDLPKAIELVVLPAAGDSLPALLRYPLLVPLGTLR